jgi:hypothetical protein
MSESAAIQRSIDRADQALELAGNAMAAGDRATAIAAAVLAAQHVRLARLFEAIDTGLADHHDRGGRNGNALVPRDHE